MQLRPTCVIHTAAPHANADDILLKRVIEDGTNNVISACHATGVQKLVYTSSSGVIFSGYDINCGDESFPYTTTPMGMYMVAKISAEKAVLAANGQHGLLTTVLRPSGIFGYVICDFWALLMMRFHSPGDRQMITVTFRLFQEGKTHIQLGNNQNMADWTYVINVADAHVLAADKLSASPHSSVAGEIFIITNDEPWPFWDFHNGVWDRLDKYYPGHRVKRKPIIIPALFAMILGAISEFVAWLTGRPTNFTRWNCIFSCRARWHSIEKAKKMLGYRPKVNMNDGIDYLVEVSHRCYQG